MAKPKPFSATAENQSQQVALPMRGNQRLVLLLFPTFRVLRNPSREFWIATTLKLLKNLFRLWGIFLLNLRTLSWKNNEPTLFILFRAMTVITRKSLLKFDHNCKWVIAYFYFLLYSPSINKLPSLASIKKRIIILSWNLCSFVTF